LGEPGPDLRDIPSIVGGSVENRHGIVLAKSIPAKNHNIKTGEAIWQAKQKCTDLVIVPPHYNLYERCSYEFLQLLKDYAPAIEIYSIDECWCDVSGTASLFGSPVALANLIKDKTFKELGFSVNIGVSTNKLLSKVASNFKKPNQVHTLYPDQIADKMWSLPVGDLFYVGRATKRKLYSLGIYTIVQLANMNLDYLRAHFKKHGEVIWAYVNGIDNSELTVTPPPNKGYGNSTTIAFDIEDAKTAKHVLLSLSESVCLRMRHDGVYAQIVSIGVKNNLFEYASHQLKTPTPTNTTMEFYYYACRLFDQLWDHSSIRHLSVRGTDVTKDKFNQMQLFNTKNYDKFYRADRTIDTIRNRYGNDSIIRASFLNSPIYHMTGGMSREKNGPTKFERRDDNCKKLFQ